MKHTSWYYLFLGYIIKVRESERLDGNIWAQETERRKTNLKTQHRNLEMSKRTPP
jgi:hypothetical protein